jgi:hypothetical protein
MSPNPLSGFIPNPLFGRQYLASDEAVPMLTKAGEAVAKRAADTVRKRSGNLARSIEVEVGVDRDDVQTARINANDFKAHWWEFGFEGRVDPYLRPAAESVVGKVQGGDK